MYIAPCDRDILWSSEMRQLKESYSRKFGEPFPPFSYERFKREETKCAAEVYMEDLKKALARI